MITLTDLRAEAAAEVCRLTNARALMQNGDEDVLGGLEDDAAWIAFPRRSRVRRALAGRICLIWRVAFEDGSGRTVEARLVPLLIHAGQGRFDRARSRRDQVRTLLRELEDEARARVEAACDEWASAATKTTGAFVTARLNREDAIERLPQRPQIPSQPGLFDRRTERAQQAHAVINDGVGKAAVDRVRAIADRGTLARQPARLLLVLVP
jgi:hypothetical protein